MISGGGGAVWRLEVVAAVGESFGSIWENSVAEGLTDITELFLN
jgi:hypothetical protein